MAKPIRLWEILLASFIGGSFLCVADILFNSTPVTTRIAGYFGNFLGEKFNSSTFEFVAFLVLILLGVGLCFVNQPKSRRSAFGQGSSVIAVLFTMNTGASIFGLANAQTLELSTTAQIATVKPRVYGPLGLGTLLTGRSLADDQTVMFEAPASVDCVNILAIGSDSYCRIEYQAIAESLADTSRFQDIQPDQNIWILQPSSP